MTFGWFVYNDLDILWKQSDMFEEEQVKSNVHIRVQQRNGRKCVTTVQGLADDLDLKKIVKYVKKVEFDILFANKD